MTGLTVIYDGYCGLCNQTVKVLGALDWLGRLVYLDATKLEQVRTTFPALPTDRLLEEIHIVNNTGRYWTGYEGARRVAWALPSLWLLAPAMYVPGVTWLGRRIYRYVAANRARNLCEDGTCAVKFQ